jgi:hydroxymethylglutaryl-CoA synthase
MSTNKRTSVGIDDMALYIPNLYLPIKTLAEKRGIVFEKLNKGLGLEKMAIPDVHEDAATMAANAVVEIIEKNQINPNDIGRIYMGTESALDGAKPTATYMLEMLRRKYRDTYGTDCLLNCDVVDLTFACVGGVDALQNTLDWVRNDEDRIGIVVCSDFAKYELASTGEYTQGAGAIAMLVKHNPRLIEIGDTFGVATRGVHDFFKPKRKFEKKQIIEEVLCLAGISDVTAEEILSKLPDSLSVHGVLDENDSYLTVHKDTPIFDGPYSNQTYQNRIKEALEDYRNKQVAKNKLSENEPLLNKWQRLIFHLPYAAHGRRIASEIFLNELKLRGLWNDFSSKYELTEPISGDFSDEESFNKAYGSFLRAITKTEPYRLFSKTKIGKSEKASGEVGNMYACSIFLALMGTLENDYSEGTDLAGEKFGFFGYGSGSKSKVFEGKVQPEWKTVVANFNIQQKLDARMELDYETYEALHKMELKESVQTPNSEFQLSRISTEELRNGARYYEWAEVNSLVS